ncbi:MAG TPA: winged helix-turn-helix domain-containing protein [Hyphomicrobiaceae bacterium]|nr:winged helix-turn-helix domain-containing protein [Hyphomicrobiaceae bacterium]
MARVDFGPFSFDTITDLLMRDGDPIALGGRSAALLKTLLAADSGVVNKDALLASAWPGAIVEENNLTVQIAALRKVLGRRADGTDWIATVPRIGYRMVREIPEPSAWPAEAMTTLPAIAVLPFANLGGDPEQEYFADGVVMDITAALSRFRSFAVIARNSSFVYKGHAIDVRQVAKDLGVRYVLEGSVRRGSGKLRIIAQLVDATTGAHLWAEHYDGAQDEIFDFQDRITEGVVGLIAPNIQRAEIERARRKPPQRLDAYDLFLQAQARHHSTQPEDNAYAFRLLERAIELTPNFSPALSFAASVLEFRIVMGWSPLTADDRQTCLGLVERAVLSASDDPQILGHLGVSLISVGHDAARGLPMVRDATDANPNDANLAMARTVAELHVGDLDAALDSAQRALRLSPGDPEAHWGLTALAHIRMATGDYSDALAWAERSHAKNPRYDANYWMLIAANAQLGRIEEARRWLGRFVSLRPGATLSRIQAAQAGVVPDRMAAILDGLRLAGLPET